MRQIGGRLWRREDWPRLQLWLVWGSVAVAAFLGTAWIATAHDNVGDDNYWYGNRECRPSDNDPCAADNLNHTFCWGGDFNGEPARDAARYALSNLVEQTQFTRDQVDCGPNTDVAWHKFDEPNLRGRYNCVDATGTASPRSCQKARVFLNTDLLNSQSMPEHNRKKTSCHEIGHSGGLKHYDDGAGCMILGHVSSGPIQYTDHQVGHLNQNDF